MKLIKKTKEYSIYQKKSGRYGIKNAANKWINGDSKTKILADEKLITVVAAAPTPVEEAPAEEAPAEETAAE